MESLRALLQQRAARLQERPALSAPGWGTLDWTAWRARVEGLAFGLMDLPAGTPVHCATGGPWAWAAEVAAACCGLRWDPAGLAIDPAVLGGARFNGEGGRGPYHDRERSLAASTPFLPGLDHGELLRRLRRLNGELGWDHETRIALPLAELPTSGGRAALWSLLYAGGHVLLDGAGPGAFEPGAFQGLLRP